MTVKSQKMDLYILRHGIAEDRPNPASASDSQRRLTDEGRQKMYRAARGMRSLELNFDLILSSPFLRAHETAQIVAEEFKLTKLITRAPFLEPDSNPKILIDELRGSYSQLANVLLVGHEPFLSRLISLLISGDINCSVQVKKGALCKLSVGAIKYGRCATLEWQLTSSHLRKLA